MPPSTSLSDLASVNVATTDQFVAALGDLYEHSPWVAERASLLRPFETMRALAEALFSCAVTAAPNDQLTLLRAHPELAGTEATNGTLTPASTSEQSRLGLDRLSPEALARLGSLNQQYRAAFGFPCIIALRLHPNPDSVFEAFESRLKNTRAREIYEAMAQIEHIVRGRIAHRFSISVDSL
jgi:OHCU decarboxylase